VLLLAAAWFGPRLLAWDQHRERIAEIAGDRLGRAVTIQGPITLVLLPQPRIEAGTVAIGAAEDGLTVTARALRLQLALPPLLAGRFEPREVTLVGGDISLPWPPHVMPGFRPPYWFGTLDARVEDSRLRVGGLTFEGLNARIASAGATEPIRAEGTASFRRTPLRFSAQLGRAGFDGIAPLDLGLAALGANLTASGLLTPADGFEGRLDVAGPDLAALLPAPAVPFRASGKLTASADLFAADGLSLELGGEPARGAVSLRVAPAPRLDVTLAAGKLDLEGWIAALRAARGAARPVPLGIDLSAEATTLAGVPLRRLRGSALLEGERLALSDVTATLPGDTIVELSGATAGERLELAVHLVSAALRETLSALGLPLTGLDPARLRQAEARFKLGLQEGEATVADLVAALDGARITGGGNWRAGPRPLYGLGLTIDRLDLDGLLDALPAPRAVSAAATGFDLNLRLAADRAAWRGHATERAGLDLSLENGRLALRRLGFRLGEVELLGAGAAQLGATPRLQESSLELSGSSGTALAALLPAALAPLVADRLALKLAGSGTAEALAVTGEGDLGDLRVEASGTLDLVAEKGSGSLTARHPGAPRLLMPWLGDAAAAWLGQGSFSTVATLSGTPATLTAEHLDLVAGTLRGRGQLTLAREGPRPRLTGRFAADTLPLPPLAPRSPMPIRFAGLAALDAELALEAARIEPVGLPPLTEARTALKLAEGTLRLDAIEARLAGGALKGAIMVEGQGSPPRLALDLALEGATIAGPLAETPLDLSAGRVAGEAKLAAIGHSPAALLATLGGTARVEVRDGVLVGLDLGALPAAAALPEMPAAEAALRQALAGGASAFERLVAGLEIADGTLRLADAALATEGGGAAALAGGFDLSRGSLDLRIAARPMAEGPEVALRLSGPFAAPRRLAELSAFLRWRAQR
jgi:hypothetical protein